MVITTLEAHVEPEKSALLEEEYRNATHQELDPGLVHTYLLRGVRDPQLWQIVTFWESREALDAMRNSGQPPRGVLIFKAGGAEPLLRIFDVAAEAHV